MKNIGLIIFINLLVADFCIGQKSNFIELGYRTSKFIESSFLENSKYRNQLSDPSIEIEGLVASPTGRNHSVGLKYGKKVYTNTHLVTQMRYAKMNEQVICFCHVCDKISEPETLVSLNLISLGLGTRYRVAEFNRVNFSLEAIGSFSFLLNESSSKHFGYSIHPVVQYELSDKFNINLKYGYEQSFKEYEKKEHYIEFAVSYELKEKDNY